jgi:uncharacterized HAD superfamily protein
MKKILVSDIDNTVADQFLRIKNYFNFSTNEYNYNGNSIEAVKQDEVLEYSVEAMKILSNEYEIHWLSARPLDQYDATYDWLIDKDFIVDSLTLVESHEKKIPILRKMNPDLFIDDMKYDYLSFEPKLATRFISLVRSLNINYIIFDGNWKRTLETLDYTT